MSSDVYTSVIAKRIILIKTGPYLIICSKWELGTSRIKQNIICFEGKLLTPQTVIFHEI